MCRGRRWLAHRGGRPQPHAQHNSFCAAMVSPAAPRKVRHTTQHSRWLHVPDACAQTAGARGATAKPTGSTPTLTIRRRQDVTRQQTARHQNPKTPKPRGSYRKI